jgi:hypothetical protein
MKVSGFIGSPWHKNRRTLEDLHVLFEGAVLPTQPGEFLLFLGGETGAFTLVDLGLLHPVAHVGLGQIEVLGDLADAAIAAPAELDDLSLELRSERPTGAGLLPLHGLHFGHPFRGCAPDGGCPSNRWKPSRRSSQPKWCRTRDGGAPGSKPAWSGR